MARLYADENFPLPIVEFLRLAGHDVLTVAEAGKAGFGIPDEEVLAFAVNQERAIVTRNWYDFRRLHRFQPNHCGIIICKEDLNTERQAQRIAEAIAREENLRGQLIRITRTPQPENPI